MVGSKCCHLHPTQTTPGRGKKQREMVEVGRDPKRKTKVRRWMCDRDSLRTIFLYIYWKLELFCFYLFFLLVCELFIYFFFFCKFNCSWHFLTSSGHIPPEGWLHSASVSRTGIEG